MSTRPASNDDFLAHHDPRLVVLGAEMERRFAELPVGCIGTLRRFGEVLAQRAAVRVGVFADPSGQVVTPPAGPRYLVDAEFITRSPASGLT